MLSQDCSLGWLSWIALPEFPPKELSWIALLGCSPLSKQEFALCSSVGLNVVPRISESWSRGEFPSAAACWCWLAAAGLLSWVALPDCLLWLLSWVALPDCSLSDDFPELPSLDCSLGLFPWIALPRLLSWDCSLGRLSSSQAELALFDSGCFNFSRLLLADWLGLISWMPLPDCSPG